MAAVERVLIVGAGIGGLTMAIALRERGIAVDVVELETRVLGVGITLTGTTLRALDVVGLADFGEYLVMMSRMGPAPSIGESLLAF